MKQHLQADPDETDWIFVTPESEKPIRRLRDHVDAGRIVWWGRRRFNDPAFSDIKPKSHVFASRKRVATEGIEAYEFSWAAVCGYTYITNDLIDGRLRTTVTTPRKEQRCALCDNPNQLTFS